MIFPKVTELVKWQNGDENQSLSHSRVLSFFTLCEVAMTLNTHSHVEIGVPVSKKVGYVLAYRRGDPSAIWKIPGLEPNTCISTKYFAEYREISFWKDF